LRIHCSTPCFLFCEVNLPFTKILAGYHNLRMSRLPCLEDGITDLTSCFQTKRATLFFSHRVSRVFSVLVVGRITVLHHDLPYLKNSYKKDKMVTKQ
jgi:hypothetical protein